MKMKIVQESDSAHLRQDGGAKAREMALTWRAKSCMIVVMEWRKVKT